MALCCIGGVCVPYSAFLPVLALCLKWILTKFVQAGIVPQTWLERAGLDKVIGNVSTTKSTSCCQENKTCCDAKTMDIASQPVAQMPHMQDADEWCALWKENSTRNDNADATTTTTTTTTLVAKMTASWCRPCKEIQPHFGKLASHYSKTLTSTKFCTVDVDGCDQVAAKFNVAMMPTFLVLRRTSNGVIEVVDRYAGSDAAQLTNFLAQHLQS